MLSTERKEYSLWWILIVGLMAASIPVFFVLNSLGIVGETIVEREVFKRSYQYEAAQDSRNSTIAAQMAEIEGLLADPKLDSNRRTELEAKRRALRILANSR